MHDIFSCDISLAPEATWVEIDLAVFMLAFHLPYSNYKDPLMDIKRQFETWEAFKTLLQMLWLSSQRNSLQLKIGHACNLNCMGVHVRHFMHLLHSVSIKGSKNECSSFLLHFY